MGFGFRNFVSFQHYTVLSDEYGDPLRAFLVGAFRRSVCDCYRAVCIAKKVSGETDFVTPRLEVLCRAEGDTQQDSVFISIVLGSNTEPVGLLSSIVTVGAWVEPYQDILARMVREADVLPILVGQAKCRRHATDCR